MNIALAGGVRLVYATAECLDLSLGPKAARMVFASVPGAPMEAVFAVSRKPKVSVIGGDKMRMTWKKGRALVGFTARRETVEVRCRY